MSDSVGALAGLAGLPHLSPRRLRLLLQHHDADDALDRLRSGGALDAMFVRSLRSSDAIGEVRSAARRVEVERVAARCERLGLIALCHRSECYPAQLAADPDPPGVLFALGDLSVLDARRVGIVGTRNATAGGRATAGDLGRSLADHGVTVVSGLARGIDGAAHAGVRASRGPGRPVGVVGCGLDMPYPRVHTDLWWWVARAGLLLSEWPPGTGPQAWRFPLRNRILAALCELLVVVESRERGGSLITARAALDRGVDVMAVPGSPRVRASAGTNQLLVDGAAPVTSVDDVLTALAIDHTREGDRPFDPRPRPDPEQANLLAACSDGPCTLDQLVAATGVELGRAAMAVARLVDSGWLVEAAGWFEPAGSRLCPP